MNKMTTTVCKFLINDVMCRYVCVGKIVANQGELDTHETEEFFNRLGVMLSLMTKYNPEANRKVERRNGLIVKAIVRACDERVKN